MFRRAAAIGFALALAGCTDKVVLQDVPNPTDAAVVSTDAGSGSDAGCDGGIKPIHYEQLPAQVMVLLDRSADMKQLFGSTTREDAAQRALASEVSAFQARIQFGFIEFPPDPMDFQCQPGTCCQGRGVGVPIQTYNAYYMGNAILCSSDPRGCSFTGTDSPSHVALATARDYYRANPSESEGYVLLVTSSEPSCAGDSREACSEAQRVARDLSGLGIRIIVLSVGNRPDNKNSCLSQISQSGAQNLPDGIQPLNIAMSPDDLTNALDALFNAVKQDACTWSSSPSVPPNQSLVVSIGGDKVPQIEGTGQDGWKLAAYNGTKITLSGTYCTKWLTSPQYFEPDVGYPCSFCGGPNACYPTQWP